MFENEKCRLGCIFILIRNYCIFRFKFDKIILRPQLPILESQNWILKIQFEWHVIWQCQDGIECAIQINCNWAVCTGLYSILFVEFKFTRVRSTSLGPGKFANQLNSECIPMARFGTLVELALHRKDSELSFIHFGAQQIKPRRTVYGLFWLLWVRLDISNSLTCFRLDYKIWKHWSFFLSFHHTSMSDPESGGIR